jgi:hypothetical protein
VLPDILNALEVQREGGGRLVLEVGAPDPPNTSVTRGTVSLTVNLDFQSQVAAHVGTSTVRCIAMVGLSKTTLF